MIATKLIIDNDLQETIPYISEQYNCYTCYEQFDLHPDGKVPWHWHPEIELTFVLEGVVRVLVNHDEYYIKAGDGMFINSNVLHYKEPASEGKVCTVNHVFNTNIIAGQYQSVFMQQYVLPLVECREFGSYIFRGEEPTERKVAEKIQHAYDVTEQEVFGYEMLARNDFSDIWMTLYEAARDKIAEHKKSNTLKEERVKYMMIYIHKKYADKLTLEQIAEAANISKRECLRSFSEILNMTPFHYLMEYRVRKASEYLRNSNQTISEIGYNCGFSGTSYFTKVFRELRGMTPSEYRKRNRLEKV